MATLYSLDGRCIYSFHDSGADGEQAMNLQTLSGRRIWAVLKEFIQLLRDKTTLRMIIGIPIMQLLLFGFAINSDPKHLPTAVIAQDHSVFARDILTGLKNSEYFSITHEVHSEEEAQLLLQQGKVILLRLRSLSNSVAVCCVEISHIC